MKMSKRIDTTSSSLMNIASTPLHRLNTHILCSIQLTVLSSPSLFVLSLSLASIREKETVQLSFPSSLVSVSTTREEERIKEKKGLLFVVIWKGHLCTCSIVFLCSIFIIISMRDEPHVIHHQSDSQLSCTCAPWFFSLLPPKNRA